MSSFRKKSTSCTDGTSSTSSTESTSSSGSSSCSDSGSSSSDTESSSLEIDKGANECKVNEIQHKLQVNTRCKSSEVKLSSKEAEKTSTMLLMTKLRSSNVSHRSGIANEVSSEDEVLVTKKPARLLNNINSGQKRKNTINIVPVQYPQQSLGSGKAPPDVVKQHQQNITVKTVNKVKTKRQGINLKEDDETTKGKTNCSSIASSENSDEELVTGKKCIKKPTSKNMSENKQASLTKRKSSMKRNISSKNSSRLRSSEDSNTESATSSVGQSTFTSDSEPSETSNSSLSQTPKKTKMKRNSEPTSEELGEKGSIENRKITRSLSMRQGTKHFLNQCITETDSEIEADMGKYHFGKNKPKRGVTSNIVNKTKNKKDCAINKPRLQSPHATIEKKCPIEGCDSSGHLSGNQDKHFLSEACPIYHNMSASECKERANERKQRDEIRLKIGHQESMRKLLSPEQKEYKAKIRESRNSFRPMSTMNAEKIKVEKDCPDDDREPNLIGIAPDYDLQLFREAQAIASEKIEEEFKDLSVGKGIKYITMGKYKMKVWYQSPYPDDAARLPQMYICEFCLRYQKSETGIKRHAQKCVWRHPPGDEIYRKGKLQVWQVDGKRQKQYCQHLCLLAKFFLDHKTLYYDVEPFLFYIMTLADIDGCHTVGYFSKEKNSFYNVSCILTLPPYQRKGYGRLLIDFSYLLTRVEGKIGSPEKPLSDLGLISYRSYWKDVLLDFLCNRSGSTLSIKDVSQEMAIYSYDIVSTLQALGMMKYWKGKHIVLKKQDVLDEYEERVKRRGNFPKIDDTCLRWSPFIPSQSNLAT